MIRHAKSDWNASYSSDHQRPLNSRGRKAAARMGRFLRGLDITPDWILSSSALRARTTAELAAQAAGWTSPVQLSDALYGASPQLVLEEIRSTPHSAETLLLAGHEPTWSQTCGLLVGGAEVRYPTAALACIHFEASSWSGVQRGRLQWFVPPRILEPFEV